jgi:hypothetical protein
MSESSNNRAMAFSRARRVYYLNCHVLANWNRATTQENIHCVLYKCHYFLISVPCLRFASQLSVRLRVVNLVFQAEGYQFFQWEDIMEQMPPINHIVHSPPTTIQTVLKVVVLRDRMDMMVDHLKWIRTVSTPSAL